MAGSSWFLGGLVLGLLIGLILVSVFGFSLPGLPGSISRVTTVTETMVSTVLTPTTISVPVTTTVTKEVKSTTTVPLVTTTIRETETIISTTTLERTVTETIVSPTTVTKTKTMTTTITISGELLPPTTRCFDLYEFSSGYWVKTCTSIGPLPLDVMRPMPLYRGEESRVLVPLIINGSKDPNIRDLAEKLWELSGGNVELFAHYTLWALYQLSYNKTRSYDYNIGVQYPIYTLYSGSGVCIDYAVLYASILKTENVEIVIILANVTGDGIVNTPHAMVGVKLSSPPKLPLKYHDKFGNVKLSDSIVVNGETYYIADPSPPPGVYVFENNTLVPPTMVYPAFVGEDVWYEIKLIDVISINN